MGSGSGIMLVGRTYVYLFWGRASLYVVLIFRVFLDTIVGRREVKNIWLASMLNF